jgi:hypothetical protein
MIVTWTRFTLSDDEEEDAPPGAVPDDADSSEEAESESFDSVSEDDTEEEHEARVKKTKGETPEQKQARLKALKLEKLKIDKRRYLKQAIGVERARQALREYAELAVNQPPTPAELQEALVIIQNLDMRERSHRFVELDNRINKGAFQDSPDYVQVTDEHMAREEIKAMRIRKMDREDSNEFAHIEIERGFAEGRIQRWATEELKASRDPELLRLFKQAEEEAKRRASAGLLDADPEEEKTKEKEREVVDLEAESPLLPPQNADLVTPPSASGSGAERTSTKRSGEDSSERDKKAQRINSALIEGAEYGYKYDADRYSHHHCRTCGTKGATVRADVRKDDKHAYFCNLECSDAYVTEKLRRDTKHMHL